MSTLKSLRAFYRRQDFSRKDIAVAEFLARGIWSYHERKRLRRQYYVFQQLLRRQRSTTNRKAAR